MAEVRHIDIGLVIQNLIHERLIGTAEMCVSTFVIIHLMISGSVHPVNCLGEIIKIFGIKVIAYVILIIRPGELSG